jgi:hypothetical protein
VIKRQEPSDASCARSAWDTSVCCGGKTAKYQDRLPGVIEEAMLTLEARKPLYVLGGFGGAAAALVELATTRACERLSWKYQIRQNDEGNANLADELSRTPHAIGYSALPAMLDPGPEVFMNGLSSAENLELGQTTDTVRAADLVTLGLRRVRGAEST